MTIADEKNLLDNLPRFVAEDLARIPYVNVDSLNVIAMARKLEALEQRMLNMELQMTSRSDKVVQESRQTETTGGSDGAEGPSDSSDATDSAAVLPWNVVTHGKPRNVSRNDKRTHAAYSSTTNLQDDKPKARQKVMGTRSGGAETSLKAGVTIIRKSFVHVDNLGPDCTEALLRDYLLAADINVISCYKASSWLRDTEKDKVTAFRVCIPAAQRHMIFDPDLWSQGTIIRDWRFRQNNNGGIRNT